MPLRAPLNAALSQSTLDFTVDPYGYNFLGCTTNKGELCSHDYHRSLPYRLIPPLSPWLINLRGGNALENSGKLCTLHSASCRHSHPPDAHGNNCKSGLITGGLLA